MNVDMANNNNLKNKVANAPLLRFPEFEGDFSQGVIEDLCEIKTGCFNTQDKIEDGQYPFYVRSSVVERINKYNFEGEAILTAGDGVGVGKVFHYTFGKIGVHQRVYILSNFKCDGKFLYYYFSSRFFDRVKKMNAKNSVDSVRHDMIAKMPITYPKYEEQKKIAKLLTLIDKRIELQKSAIEKLKSLMAGICSILLNPKGARLIPIKEFLIERIEKTTVNNQHEVLSSTIKGLYSQKEYFSKEIASENNIGYKILRKNDIVLSPQNLYMGNINFNDKFEKGIVSPSYKIYSISEDFNKTYVSNVLRTHRALFNYMMISEQGASVVRRNLNIEDFENLKFPIPAREAQDNIAKKITALNKKIELENSIFLKFLQQKQYLHAKMFV